MYFLSTVLLFLSALQVATAQQPAVCSQLAGYQPATTYCAAKYPAPIPTVTRTMTTTVTVKATTSVKPSTTTTSSKPNTSSTTTKANTTSAAGNGRTRTITAIAEETVTNCAGFTRPACPASTSKINLPSPGFTNPFNNVGGFVRPVSPVPNRPSWGRVSPREAEPEADPQFGGFGGFGGSLPPAFQFFTWARLLQSGNSAIQSACSCLRPAASRTVTISATATVTTTIK